MLSRLKFKAAFRAELQKRGVKYNWDHRTYFKKYEEACSDGMCPDAIDCFVEVYYMQALKLGNLQASELPTPKVGLNNRCVPFAPEYSNPCVPQQEQGNNPMNYNQTNAVATVIADTSEKDKRQHLANRLNDIFYERHMDVEEMFGFGAINYPKSAKEAMERIQAGKFTIAGLNDEKPRYRFYWDEAFSWRDPSVKQDEEGRDAALSELEHTRDGLLDIVKVKSLDEAFDTLKALQEWQPAGKAN